MFASALGMVVVTAISCFQYNWCTTPQMLSYIYGLAGLSFPLTTAVQSIKRAVHHILVTTVISLIHLPIIVG